MNDIELRKWCLEFAKNGCFDDETTIIEDADKVYNWITQESTVDKESTDNEDHEMMPEPLRKQNPIQTAKEAYLAKFDYMRETDNGKFMTSLPKKEKPPLGFDPIYLAGVDEIPELEACLDLEKIDIDNPYNDSKTIYVGDVFATHIIPPVQNSYEELFNVKCKKYKLELYDGSTFWRPCNIEELREQYKDEIEARIKG